MLIQVAISILMLMGFTVFVVDYGIVWVSRAQAQNAADAGALSGGLARRYDDKVTTPATNGTAWMSAVQVANENLVWGQQGIVQPSWACPTGWTGYRCTRVDVYRNGENGSATLPVFFGPHSRRDQPGRESHGHVCGRQWRFSEMPEAVDRRRQVARRAARQLLHRAVLFRAYRLQREHRYRPAARSERRATRGRCHQDGPGHCHCPIHRAHRPYEANISGCNQTVVGIATAAQMCGTVNEPVGCVSVQTGVQQGQTVHGIADLIFADRFGYWDPGDQQAGRWLRGSQQLSRWHDTSHTADCAL